ncbi:MAG: hypothetical protein KIS85_07980 [Anaerolineales bacterium]|nr:hypothetical protein [Anaerolineales bacterium]
MHTPGSGGRLELHFGYLMPVFLVIGGLLNLVITNPPSLRLGRVSGVSMRSDFTADYGRAVSSFAALEPAIIEDARKDARLLDAPPLVISLTLDESLLLHTVTPPQLEVGAEAGDLLGVDLGLGADGVQLGVDTGLGVGADVGVSPGDGLNVGVDLPGDDLDIDIGVGGGEPQQQCTLGLLGLLCVNIGP